MKNIFLLLLSFTISCALLAQNNLKTNQEKPHPGDVVKFTYTPPAALANEKDPLKCSVYRMGNYNDFYGEFSPLGKPVEMEIKKTGATYSGEVKTEDAACGLVFCFSWGDLKIDRQGVCTSGKMDNNEKRGYFVPFFTADNKPCPTAYARMGKYLSYRFANPLNYRNQSLAREYYLKEMENYPEKSSSIVQDIFNNTYDPKTDSIEKRNFATKQIEKIFTKKPTTDADYLACNLFFNALGLKQTANYFYEYAMQQNIEGYFRAANLDEKTRTETDLINKKLLLDSAIVCYKSMDFYIRYQVAMAGGFLSTLAESYLITAYKTGDKNKFDEAVRYIQQDTKCGFEQMYPYKDLMQAALEIKKYDDALNFSAAYFSICQKKYNQLTTNPAEFHPTQGTEDVYSTKDRIRFTALQDMIELTKLQAEAYSEKGDCEKALAKLIEYGKYTTYPEVKQMQYDKYMEQNIAYSTVVINVKCKPLDEATKSVEKIISGGKYDEKVAGILKELYVKKNGSEKGFTEYLLGLKNADDAEMAKKLEEMKANETAPDFDLVDLDGKKVKLSELKGKTVILDFWATWCGPCRTSFPAMQQLVDYYKPNPDVVFLFIDTFEGKTGVTTLDKMQAGAKKTMAEKNFSFHVVSDLGDEVAKKYKVTGIPAKFVIDKNGMIRYKAVGSGLFSDLVNEMMAMVKSVR